MAPSAESIAPNPEVRNPEFAARPNEKVAAKPKGCVGCGTIEKALMAPKPNAGMATTGRCIASHATPVSSRWGLLRWWGARDGRPLLPPKEGRLPRVWRLRLEALLLRDDRRKL